MLQTTSAEITGKLNKKDVMYYVNSFIVVLIMFGFGALPPISTITELGMDVLGIFLALLYGWIFVDLVWPSLLSLLALGLTGYVSVPQAFAQGFGDGMALMVFLVSVFAAFMSISGLNLSIANWFVSRKICVGRPWVLMGMIILAAFITSATGAVFGALFIMWGVFYDVCDSFGIQKKESYAAVGIIGIVIAITLGCTAFLFFPFPVLVMGIVSKTAGTPVEFWPYSAFSLILSACIMIAYVLIGKYVIRADVSKIQKANSDYLSSLQKKKLNNEQKFSAVLLVIFMVALIAPSILPKTWALQQVLADWSIIGCAAFMLVILCAVRIHGKPVVTFSQLAKAGIPWEIIVLYAATMPVSAAMESPEAGIIEAIMPMIQPLFSGMSPVVFLAVATALCFLLTQVIHNTVLAVVLTPVLIRVALGIGANPLILGVVITFALQLALATPGGSVQSAMMHGNEWVSTKQAYGYSMIAVGACIVLTVLAAVLLGDVFFPMTV